MSRGGEHKRVTLTSIIQGDAGFSRFGSNLLEPDAPPSAGSSNGSKPAAKPAKCIRIELDLFKTDSNKYPEFNYPRLLYLEKKKAKKLKQVTTCNNADPFADNDDDVARIVKELEAKYGNSYATGRGKSKKDDYVDIGMGYDESDSFIDNTDAYDEIIPAEAETLEGGFYINCGALEFKNLTKKSYTTRTDAIIKMPERSRKRMISSSSESSSSSSDDDEENDGEGEGEGEEEEESDSEDDSDEEDESDSEDDSESESLEDEDSAATAKSSSKYKDNHVAKRPKVIVTGKSKPGSSSSAGGKKPPVKPITTSSSSNSPRPSTVEISDTEEVPGQVQIQPPSQLQALPQTQSQAQAQAQALKKVVKTTTVKDMLKAKRDSFLKSQSGTAAVKGVVNGELKCISTDVSDSDSSDMESATEQGRADRQGAQSGKEGQENLRTADTVLPATLDAEIVTAVNSFKEAVRSRDMCGKKFSLDARLAPLLLRVYEAVLCTDRNERNMVFSHIEYQLQLPKYYMLRKGKQVRAKEEKKKSTNTLDKLRRAVAVVMPKAIANYETELRTFAEQAAADVNSELPPKMPRKKFQWTSELRQLLYDVYQARWTSYAFLAKRKDSLEEFINMYLKEKVVDLWPNGWMRLDELQREITRYKNAKVKAKEKPKPVVAASVPEQLPQASSYLKPAEEPRSRGNSDTDSATSASSNSLKRKLNEMPSKQSNKPPKKKVAKQLPQQPQFQLAPAATAAVSVPAISNNNNNNHLPHLDTLLSMPSTSAHAAALNAAAVAAAAASTVLDLASPSRKMDLNSSSNFYNLITAATLAASGNPSPHSSDNQAKVIAGARPSPHVINLDDYQCTSEILQTSKQLAATTSVITSTSKAAQTTPVGRESSSESDGVEIVGVFPASKPQKKVQPKPKNKTQNRGRSSLGQVNGLGFSTNNMYIYNSPRSLGPVYDLTDPHIMKTMSNLKEMEKQFIQAAFSPNNVKGATGGGMGSSAPSTPSRQ
ncbi:yemanuclein [Drosophila takahashii]|uniref:yemanuclein n=1 Tax=Drosophila takahashii TaxID=29030 RepID=UPI001CF8FBED|nr:yemanuclein [Drosophila takahashii]